MASDPLHGIQERPGDEPERRAGDAGEIPSSPRLSTSAAREGDAPGLDLRGPGPGAEPMPLSATFERVFGPSKRAQEERFVAATRRFRVAELVEILDRQARLAPGLHSWLDRRLYVGFELAFMLVREQILARTRAAFRRLGVAT